MIEMLVGDNFNDGGFDAEGLFDVSDDGNNGFYDVVDDEGSNHVDDEGYDGQRYDGRDDVWDAEGLFDGSDDGNNGFFDDDNNSSNKDGDSRSLSLPPSSSTTIKLKRTWTEMGPRWKQKELKRVRDFKQKKRLKHLVEVQKRIIQDLHTKMKTEKSIVPLASREDQISFLETLFAGDSDASFDFNLLRDVELKTKYATAYIYRMERPKMKIAKFRKQYATEYLE